MAGVPPQFQKSPPAQTAIGSSGTEAHLNSAVAALNRYIAAEPDAADKQKAQSIILDVKALVTKDRSDTRSGSTKPSQPPPRGRPGFTETVNAGKA